MISRRSLLKAILATAALWPGRRALAATETRIAPQEKDGFLSLYNIHTKEALSATYRAGGIYDPKALDAINRLLRCHYTNEARPVDVGVLDLLCRIKDRYGERTQIHVISGYRSRAYNELLRKQGHRVAGGSYHLRGLAVDFTLPGVGNDDLFGAARSLEAGGVGRYPDFVHIDVGPVRSW